LGELTLAVIARIPREGIADFQGYEARVLPLLAEHGGVLERRLRNGDGTLEMHVLRFASRAGLEAYRADARRQQAAPQLERSGAAMEVVEVTDVN
jgi:hypothetical protein